jgi:hypothetical protein
MRAVSTFSFVLLSLLPIACGESGSNPSRRREAEFRVQASSGTPFRVFGFETSNGPSHVFDPPREFLAPVSFFLLNSGPPPPSAEDPNVDPPVSGTFSGSGDRTPEDVRISLSFGFEDNLVASGTVPAGSTGEVTVATPGPLPQPIESFPEVRIEVGEETNVLNAPFTATIGDDEGTFLPCGDTTICTTPVIFYFENARGGVSGIVSKAVRDDQVLVVSLFLNGVLRDTARATRGNLNARVSLDL